jgi:hypothetical protein
MSVRGYLPHTPKCTPKSTVPLSPPASPPASTVSHPATLHVVPRAIPLQGVPLFTQPGTHNCMSRCWLTRITLWPLSLLMHPRLPIRCSYCCEHREAAGVLASPGTARLSNRETSPSPRPRCTPCLVKSEYRHLEKCCPGSPFEPSFSPRRGLLLCSTIR